MVLQHLLLPQRRKQIRIIHQRPHTLVVVEPLRIRHDQSESMQLRDDGEELGLGRDRLDSSLAKEVEVPSNDLRTTASVELTRTNGQERTSPTSTSGTPEIGRAHV